MFPMLCIFWYRDLASDDETEGATDVRGATQGAIAENSVALNVTGTSANTIQLYVYKMEYFVIMFQFERQHCAIYWPNSRGRHEQWRAIQTSLTRKRNVNYVLKLREA